MGERVYYRRESQEEELRKERSKSQHLASAPFAATEELKSAEPLHLVTGVEEEKVKGNWKRPQLRKNQ